MTYFHVKVMESYMDASGINGGAVAVGRGSKVDTAFWILRHAAFQAASLADNIHDMTLICERIEMARSSMEQTASKFENMKSEQFMLPNLSRDYIYESNFCTPQVILPDYVEPLKSALSTTELRQRVHDNIGWLPYFPKSTVDFPALELWMKQDKLSSKQSRGWTWLRG